MFLRRVAAFVPCQVEAHNAPVTEGDSQFCSGKGEGGALVAHCAEDEASGHARLFLPPLQAVKDSLDSISGGEALFQMQVGGKADLCIADMLAGEVLHSLKAHSFKRLCTLDRKSVV